VEKDVIFYSSSIPFAFVAGRERSHAKTTALDMKELGYLTRR
jgi:hypothetical protein